MQILSWLRRRPAAPGPPVVVFGSGRSGTTWLAQTLAAAGLELVFEPLNEAEVPEAAGFRPHPLYAAPGDAPPFADLVERALAGQVRSEWTIRENPGARRRVVKFIRANLIAAWLLDRFPAAPVFIVRNPLSVVASWRVQGWQIGPGFASAILRRADLAPFLDGLQDVLQDEPSEAASCAALWCVQNHVPRAQGLFERVPLVRYEHLCDEPVAVLDDLLPRLGLRLDRRVRDQVRRPSLMARGARRDPGYDPRTAWREVLTEREVDEVVAVVRRFGLEDFVELDPASA